MTVLTKPDLPIVTIGSAAILKGRYRLKVIDVHASALEALVVNVEPFGNGTVGRYP